MEERTLKTCMKCGVNFYSESEYKTHVRECKGRVSPDLTASKNITQEQAASGNFAPASDELAKINDLRDEAKKLGIKNITSYNKAELVAKIEEIKTANKE